MANAVYTVEEITLQDGSAVELRPLNISRLRKFMVLIDEFGNAESEDDGFETLLVAAALCISNKRPEFWDETVDRGEGKPRGKYTPDFEEVADMPTVYHILDVCGGVKLNDPNLLAAAAQAAALGQNSTS